MGALTPGTVTVIDSRPWVPCLIVLWTRATWVLDASLAMVTAVLVACPGQQTGLGDRHPDRDVLRARPP